MASFVSSEPISFILQSWRTNILLYLSQFSLSFFFDILLCDAIIHALARLHSGIRTSPCPPSVTETPPLPLSAPPPSDYHSIKAASPFTG